jgi:hypothetical protein
MNVEDLMGWDGAVIMAIDLEWQLILNASKLLSMIAMSLFYNSV